MLCWAIICLAQIAKSLLLLYYYISWELERERKSLLPLPSLPSRLRAESAVWHMSYNEQKPATTWPHSNSDSWRERGVRARLFPSRSIFQTLLKLSIFLILHFVMPVTLCLCYSFQLFSVSSLNPWLDKLSHFLSNRATRIRSCLAHCFHWSKDDSWNEWN